MARKNNSNDGNNEAEIEVFYFKGKNVNGDLAATINAIANTIRPTPIQAIPLQPPPSQLESRRTLSNGNGQQELHLDEDDNEKTDILISSSAPKTTTRDKKPFKGKIDDTIAWDGNGTAFVDYVRQRKPEETSKKFLVIASWFKRHGGQDAVGSNLVYNGYRKLGWQALNDMTQPLRDGAKSDRGYYISTGKGMYAITNIGLDAADKVGSEKSGSE